MSRKSVRSVGASGARMRSCEARAAARKRSCSAWPRARQSQRAGASVLRIDPPLDMARSGEAMDEVMRAHRIDPQARRQAALVGVRYFLQRSDHSELDRRQIGALGNLCRDAQADLMEAPRQVGGDPVTLWDAVFGRLRHNPNIASYL